MPNTTWTTPDGHILRQLDAQPASYGQDLDGVPGVVAPEAYRYVLQEADTGAVLERFDGTDTRTGLWTTHTTIVRYLVRSRVSAVAGEPEWTLFKLVFHCHEESSFDLPIVHPRDPVVVLAGLVPTDDQPGSLPSGAAPPTPERKP